MISKNNSNVPAAALTKGDFCYIILIEIDTGGGAKMLEGYAMTIIGKSKSDNTDNFSINGKIRFDAEDKYLAAWDDVTHKKNVYAAGVPRIWLLRRHLSAPPLRRNAGKRIWRQILKPFRSFLTGKSAITYLTVTV